MTRRRSIFSHGEIHRPPGVRQPYRLLVIRGLRALLAALPRGVVERTPRLRGLAGRLELAELWRTDILDWRVATARRMGMRVGERCRLYSLNVAAEAELVELGDDVIVSGEVMFVTHDGAIFVSPELFPNANNHYGRIRIGNGCFIGMRAIIMPGVELGEKCIVAAGAVVMDSFAAGSVVAGNPATYVCPTSIYLQLKRHAPGTVYDEEWAYPKKYPPALLAARMADVPFKVPRRRTAQRPAATGAGAPRPASGGMSTTPTLPTSQPGDPVTIR